MKKLNIMLGALAIAMCGLVGCAKAPTDEEYAAWATEHGYVANPAEHGWVENPAEHGWVENPEANGYAKLGALPASQLDTTKTKNGEKFAVANCGVTLYPTQGSTQKKALDYLGRPDVVYIDARDAKSYINGHIEGFEFLPYFDIIAGTYNQLFNVTSAENVYTVVDRYEESVMMMKKLIPTDKTVFLMCQSGGRIVAFMSVLEHCGYDMTKVYNIGGWGAEATAKGAGYRVEVSQTTVAASYDWTGLTKIAGVPCIDPNALPASQLDTTKEFNFEKFAVANSGITLYPTDGSQQKKALNYLDRKDVVYIDARDAQSYINGHIEGFEFLPYFDIVGATTALFTVTKETNGAFTVKANYEESELMMKNLIPTDKTVFLMCQSGGRIVQFMAVLDFCGYDMTKVYNIGGWGAEKTAKDAGYNISKAQVTVTATYAWTDLTPVA